jgi:membrane protein implicated in regulation of membrane protease activity
MAMAIVLGLLVFGSVLFHLLSPWYFTPIASNWGTIDDTISLTFWVTGVVFVAVNLFMAYCVVRFRQRKGSKAEYEPENKKLEIWLTGLTTLGVAAGAGSIRLGKICRCPERCGAARGGRQAVALELSLPRSRWQAGCGRRQTHQ